jgi:hypothetical protein
MNRDRRAFLADVGKGMLTLTVGPALATDLGVGAANAEEAPKAITFGEREPLVALMQETPADKLLPLLVEKLKGGTDLGTLVTAAALANARTFGGEDYIGFHTFMALLPAYQMAKELPADQKALPILKVIYRNTTRIQAFGGKAKEVLKPVVAGELPRDQPAGEALREATRNKDKEGAEKLFAAMIARPEQAYNDLQLCVDDDADVHRVVLAWRAWDMLNLVGKDQAHLMLRQSVRYCAGNNAGKWHQEVRTAVPKLLDQYKLLAKPLGTRKAEDSWIEALATTIRTQGSAKAMEAVAAALAEGFSPDAVAEAIAVASNALILHDPGRLPQQVSPNKPEGTVHGDSVGVHASDAANAWRHIARVGDQRTTLISLIVAADFSADGRQANLKVPHPLAEQLERITAKDGPTLLRETEAAIKDRNQARAAALVARYGELGLPARAVQDLMLKFACSEDGALHAEKYYATACEEFGLMRPAFRWRQLVALARVTASEYGYPAPGFGESCKLLKV